MTFTIGVYIQFDFLNSMCFLNFMNKNLYQKKLTSGQDSNYIKPQVFLMKQALIDKLPNLNIFENQVLKNLHPF